MNEQMENVLRERCTNEYDYKLRYPKFAKLLNPITRSSVTGSRLDQTILSPD